MNHPPRFDNAVYVELDKHGDPYIVGSPGIDIMFVDTNGLSFFQTGCDDSQLISDLYHEQDQWHNGNTGQDIASDPTMRAPTPENEERCRPEFTVDGNVIHVGFSGV